MQEKKCGGCGKTKPVSEFHKKGKGRWQSMCKVCRKKYHREHYLKNKATYIAKAVALRKNIKRQVAEIKVETPCADCGLFFQPVIMDFDHGDSEKKGNVSHLAISASTKKLKEEIEKCEVVCANCHRMRTYNRKHGTSFSGKGSRRPKKVYCGYDLKA
jgi:hypothetical protein